MQTIHSSAPGKLFLLGEYAVLEGAPALLTAVDRRVTVTLSTADADGWVLSAPGLGITQLPLGSDGAVPESVDGATREKLRLFDAVRTTVAAALADNTAPLLPGHRGDNPALSVSIDSSALSMGTYKLGFGGSAAVAVALTAGLAKAYGLNLDRNALFVAALTAHRLAQGPLGSGGDVATALNGGLLSYAPDAIPTSSSATSLKWPSDLTMMVVVTGTGSSTPELVGRVHDYARRDPSGYHADLSRLAELAREAVPALDSAQSFMALAAEYFTALETLDSHADAGIVSDRHRQLNALAARHRGVFKSSGAGGGDVGLAFARSGAPARELAAALTHANARIVSIGLGASGAQLTTFHPDTNADTLSGTTSARTSRNFL
ncbi:hypothetical protein [Cryobacterium sp. CG_9.6]|uniref:mevalonate kinase family protein n=1 Tax=Cryobacterium sp. CG_9.6 TaxID=2760710 RepID=UPI0024737A67|nr:hypothetical protein [Cryobacterium sp. CG_9.6]MDH6236383.1 phosphomevalonate kinase [Cryobacterium sp. CG_9.6]